MKLLQNNVIRFIGILVCISAVCASFGETKKTALPIISLSQGWGTLGIDTAVVPPTGAEPRAITIADKTYSRGLGTHAPSSILLELSGNYEKFSAIVGVQSRNTAGTVVFQLIADGKKIYDSGIVRLNDGAKSVEVSVRDVYELELVVTDGGDGRNSDAANWANAELLRLPDAEIKKWYERELFDISQFAKLYTWNPEQIILKPHRTKELSVEQIFVGTELVKPADGIYEVPVAENGEKCIGFQWYDNRHFRGFMVEFADGSYIPDSSKSRVEWWAGHSALQGEWLKLSGDFEVIDNRWYIAVEAEDITVFLKKIEDVWNILSGSIKVRFIFPQSKEPVILSDIKTFSRDWFDEVGLVFHSEQGEGLGELEIYNGVFLDKNGENYIKSWDLSKSLEFKVKYCLDKSYPKSDRTIINIRTPGGDFSVAVDDIIENGGVYVPTFGFYATVADNPTTMQQYIDQKVDGKKTVLEKVRQMPDQSFVRAMEKTHRKVQNAGPTMVSLAGDNAKFIVEESGLVLVPITDHRGEYTGKSFFVTPTFGSGHDLQTSRHLEGGWMPIPVQSYVDGDVEYIQKSFTAPSSKARNSETDWLAKEPVFVSEFTVSNNSAEPANATIKLEYSAKTNVPAVLTSLAEGFKTDVNGKWNSFTDVSTTSLDVALEGNKLTISGVLPPLAKQRFALYITGWAADDQELQKLFHSQFLLRQTKRYWSNIIDSSVQIDIPNEFLKNLIYASQVHCMIAGRNEENGKRIAPWISAEIYGPLESESQSIIRGMSLMGQEEFARRCNDFFINRYNDDGLLTTGYTLMGLGSHLWTLGDDYYLIHRNTDWFKEVAPKLENACNWIVRQREKTKVLDAYGNKTPGYGLMPPGVAADWERFAIIIRVQGEFWAGLRAIGQTYQDIGYPGGEEFLKSAADFKQETLRAYQWSQEKSPVIKLNNGTWIPYSPTLITSFGPVGDMYPGEDGNRAWGKDVSFGPHHLVALGLLEDSKEIDWIANYLEDKWFLLAGHGDYSLEEVRENWFDLGGFYKVQPFYCRIAEVYAQNDDVKPYIRAYFNATATMISEENLAFWEHFHNIGGWNKTHETGWFLTQSRLMLLMEKKDDLWLAPFVTNHWMKDGMTVAVDNAQTRFGSVGYKIVSNVDKGFITAEIDPPTRNEYKSIVLRLRHPDGKTMKSVTVNGKPYTDFNKDKEYITLSPSKERIQVRAEYGND